MKLQRYGKVIEKQPISCKDKKLIPKTNNFMLDVTDINCKENKSKRCTNPLDPKYTVET